ncbi:MAG TPA: hypothetical protein VHO70_02270, partial [Chitinispirillaceae bacterium]|nr:hypothetical protein [Chitinispirillaceae bacterium]
MNIYPLIILVLLLTVLFFSIFRILHLPISKISRFFLSAFRVLLIFLITIAFLEPSFQFERLSPVNRTIPVLIDNSKSMSLFYPESTIIPFTKSLYAINNKCSGKNNRFAIYTFGDSLKKAIDSLTFFENRSNFPVLTRNSIIDKSPSIIIVSDANWTNRVQLSSMAETKTLYYIKLPKPHQSCHFYSDVKSSPGSTKDSIHFTFTITGFTTDSQSIILRCVTTDTTLYQKAFAIAPGSVQQTLDFNLKKLFPGLHVLRFQALINDSIVNEYRHLQLVSKDMYHYRTRFSTPSLDNRFLQLAFARDSSFMATDSDTADLLIISNYTGELSKKLSSISKNELLFFAGTLPCQPLRQSTTNVLIADYSSYSGFNRSGTATLPPISVYHNCLQLPAARIYAWVSSGQEHPDTIPALFTTTYNDKTALILSLTNFWKWDFYPLVSNFGEENTFAFSKRIVDAVKELLSLQSSSVY